MGLKSGNKGRHFRAAHKKRLRRMHLRALRAALQQQKAAPPAAERKTAVPAAAAGAD